MTEIASTPGSEGQTFLVGETLYLRGLELADAKRAPAWRASPFPINAERAEEVLKKELPAQAEHEKFSLIACRRSDDAPVGAAVYQAWDWRIGEVWISADRALGQAGQTVKAEILRLVVPWLLLERELMAVSAVDVDGGDPLVQAAAEELGMRQAVRLREAIWRDGRRHDALTYEILHPAWLARLGTPTFADPSADTRPAATEMTRSRPLPVPDGDPPRNAIMVGDRVYLRPLEIEDAQPVGRWSRQETEIFFQFNGRHVRSPITTAHSIRESGEKDPPSWIRFAIVLRDGDEYIGANGIDGIDWVHRTAETESDIFRPRHRGSGLGTEAKHLLLAYAFDRLGLHMVRSYVWAPNTRSAAALRKQGYRDAGRLHWVGLKNGDFADDLIFDLLADEWRAMRVR